MKSLKANIAHFLQSISAKVVLIILVLVLPVNLLALFFANRTMEILVDRAQDTVENVMGTCLDELEKRMENAAYFMYTVKNVDTDGLQLSRETTKSEYTKRKITLYYKVNDTCRMIGGADGYFLYLENWDDLLVWKDSAGKTAQKDIEDFVREQGSAEGSTGWNLYRLGEEEKLILSYLVKLDGAWYGGWIYLDTVLEQIRGSLSYENAVVSVSEEAAAQEGPAVSLYSPKGDFYINAVLSEKEITKSVDHIYEILQMLTIAALLILPLLYLGIRLLLLTPLRALNQAEQEIRGGNLDYRIRRRGNSLEYRQAFASFNEMASDIQKLKIETYEKELARQRMELKNLQLQIRPHFLLNTFNLIYTLSQRGESAAVQNVILYLSDYFRYLFRGERELELFEKEQHLIEGYMEMAAIRYPGCVEIEYSYDPEIRFVRLPPLLLHNFVENIVKHVVQNGTVTHVSVVGQYEEKNVTFMIMDDGAGMDPETLAELNNAMRHEKNDGSHVGFKNSYRRVKYFYGEEADIEITSEKGEGTCVTIHFPYNLEVSDESADCE